MNKVLLIFLCFFIAGQALADDSGLLWKNDALVAISLSYDDALASQLDIAVPALKEFDFNASFYPTLSSPIFKSRRNEWKSLALNGHELGNHTIIHPCRGSLPNRSWVTSHQDLDNISAEKMYAQIVLANQILFELDGKTERTFTPPCGDALAKGENYLNLVRDEFVALKGQESSSLVTTWSPRDVNGKELVDFVKRNSSKGALINIIFHGVGGDYLSVTEDAHKKLLKFLHRNQSMYWVDSYLNIMKYQSMQKAVAE